MSSKTFASQPSEITAKKKFGKNLNKQLSKPPPQSLGTAKASPTSRNGLLLLSTKRQTSGVAASSTGGILANKSASGGTAKPLPSLGLQNKSNTSTHDALLGAVVGASRAESQEPDAWGVADKCKSPTLDPTPEPKGEMISERQEEHQPSTTVERDTPNAHDKELPSANWDEYGGRNLGSDKKIKSLYSPDEISVEDEQKVAMTKKANDRAAAKRAEEGSRQNEQRDRISQRLRELDQKSSSETKPRILFDPNVPSKKEGVVEATVQKEQIVQSMEVESLSRPPIQLSSFDDQDRGERGASAVPRMLYDPKSGSMVAVPSRDDTSAGRGRKERGKKVKNVRDKESKPEERRDLDGKRKGKREKKNGSDGALHKSDSKKGNGPVERKHPRTRGVLYSRDDKGTFVSVDGCDGDLGYGSHCVPGGRIKNSDAYERFLEHQKNKRNDINTHYDGVVDESFETDGNHDEDDLMLHTGFNLPNSHEATFDWVVPGRKIELMTGKDGSPTLQATAKEWAPSQATLAAASARFGGRTERSRSYEADEDDGEDDGPVRMSFVAFDVFSTSSLVANNYIFSLVWGSIPHSTWTL